MKKVTYILIGVVMFIFLLSLSSCKNKDSDINMNHIYDDKYNTNDSDSIEDSLTKEYDIEDLISFFTNRNANEGSTLNLSFSSLSFEKVDREFPVEIIRTKGYSVYKVTQGGYFYVFWVNTFDNSTNQNGNRLDVYFSTYLPTSESTISFESLVPGVSTAKDVKKIDPFFELFLLQSHGIYSYSYLNNNEIIQIEYEYQEKFDENDDLIVKEILIVPRDSVPSRYSTILPRDIPK